MSKEDIGKFQQAFLSYTTLQERLKATTDRESFVRLAVELGEQSGYKFTAEEVESLLDEYLQSQDQLRFATLEEASEKFEVPKHQKLW